MTTFYHVTYDHQIQPKDYGNYSTFEKAKECLKSMNIKLPKPTKYRTTTIYKTSHGDYRIEEKVIY